MMEPKQENKDKEGEEGEDKPSPHDPVAEARTIAQRIEEGNKKYEELVERQERIAQINALGGETESGKPAEPKKVKSKAEEAAEFFTGTQLEKDIKKANEEE